MMKMKVSDCLVCYICGQGAWRCNVVTAVPHVFPHTATPAMMINRQGVGSIILVEGLGYIMAPISIVLVLLSVGLCSVRASNDCFTSLEKCTERTMNDEREYVKCDMCCCEELFDGNECNTENKDLYNCYVKYTPKKNSSRPVLNCMIKIKKAWITGFIVISMYICLCCFGIFAAIFWRPRDSAIKEIGQRLVS